MPQPHIQNPGAYPGVIFKDDSAAITALAKVFDDIDKERKLRKAALTESMKGAEFDFSKIYDIDRAEIAKDASDYDASIMKWAKQGVDWRTNPDAYNEVMSKQRNLEGKIAQSAQAREFDETWFKLFDPAEHRSESAWAFSEWRQQPSIEARMNYGTAHAGKFLSPKFKIEPYLTHAETIAKSVNEDLGLNYESENIEKREQRRNEGIAAVLSPEVEADFKAKGGSQDEWLSYKKQAEAMFRPNLFSDKVENVEAYRGASLAVRSSSKASGGRGGITDKDIIERKKIIGGALAGDKASLNNFIGAKIGGGTGAPSITAASYNETPTKRSFLDVVYGNKPPAGKKYIEFAANKDIAGGVFEELMGQDVNVKTDDIEVKDNKIRYYFTDEKDGMNFLATFSNLINTIPGQLKIGSEDLSRDVSKYTPGGTNKWELYEQK